jgi:hypothetical protein
MDGLTHQAAGSTIRHFRCGRTVEFSGVVHTDIAPRLGKRTFIHEMASVAVGRWQVKMLRSKLWQRHAGG